MSSLDFITDNQLRTFKSIFEHYDKEKKGLMNIKDLAKALKALSIIITTEDFQNIQSTCLVDDNKIDLPEFVSIIYYFLRATDTQDELIRAFSVFDTDKDGKIPIDAVASILSNLKHAIPKEKIDGLLQPMNDGSNLIDYKGLIKKLRPEK